ncbi:lipase 1 [Drosophila busckii]|nr:lipase 1 [Drosophila busckii]
MPRLGGYPILLVHGFMASTATWVQMGPNNGLAYILFEQGYDVWMLNTRGNLYSKAHKNPNINQKDYWKFSFHEIGIYDLPGAVDLILSVTKQPKMQYIGHSQGSTAFFVLCSEVPGYAEKFDLMQALSPTVYMQNSESPVLRFLSVFSGSYQVLVNLLGGFEIAKSNTLITQFRDHICSVTVANSEICAMFDFVTCGFGWSQLNSTLTPLVVGHASQGASSMQIYHYAQQIKTSGFHRFDQGRMVNQIVYQNPQAPQYNLSRVTCKVALQHSQHDWMATRNDVENLRLRLPRVIDTHMIEHRDFSHYDFTISKNVRKLVYRRIVKLTTQRIV